MSNENLEILKKAREIIDAGWCQFNMFKLTNLPIGTDDICKDNIVNSNQCCAVGSIVKAIYLLYGTCNDDRQYKIIQLVRKANKFVRFLSEENDSVGRTKDHVLSWFDKAISAEESKNETE